MSEKKMFAMLKQILSKDELSKLEDTLIITVPGGYSLFGEFLISKNNNKYVVSKYTTNLEEQFYSLQNATIFAILHKRNKVAEMRRMLELDILLESANADLIRYKDRGTDLETMIISSAKFQEARHRKFLVSTEISEYLRETRLWQEGRYKEAAK
jgi:hypothetical protein